MPTTCTALGCKFDIPQELEAEKLCLLHFTIRIEGDAAGMRRETVLGTAPHERQLEIIGYIRQTGERLARVATSGVHMSSEMKARVLNTFLTLMNLRENLDRASARSVPFPGAGTLKPRLPGQ